MPATAPLPAAPRVAPRTRGLRGTIRALRVEPTGRVVALVRGADGCSYVVIPGPLAARASACRDAQALVVVRVSRATQTATRIVRPRRGIRT